MAKTATIIQAPPIFVAREDAAAALGVSKGTVEGLVRTGDLPPPRKISPGRTGWLWRELVAWAEARPVSTLLPGPGRQASAYPTGDPHE